MRTSSVTPQAAVKPKRFWFPKIDGTKIAKFIKEAYFWDVEEEQEKEKTSVKTKG